jgi:photosystem II stability/assembly factor-like uncharacterized protein
VALTLRYDGAPSTSLAFVVKAGNRLYAGGTDGTLLTSPDGITWIQAPPAPPIKSLAWAGDRLVGVGLDASDNTPGVWTSANGSHWTRRYKGPPGIALNSVAASDSLIVAVGTYGTVLTSP